MATDQSTTDAPAEDETEARRPYIVVLMSAEMKAAVKTYADEHETNPTALARQLLADLVGYALDDEPVATRRTVYKSDDERATAKQRASKASGLKRKALFQTHIAQLNKRPLLLACANRMVIDLFDTAKKLTLEELEAMDQELDAAIRAAK